MQNSFKLSEETTYTLIVHTTHRLPLSTQIYWKKYEFIPLAVVTCSCFSFIKQMKVLCFLCDNIGTKLFSLILSPTVFIKYQYQTNTSAQLQKQSQPSPPSSSILTFLVNRVKKQMGLKEDTDRRQLRRRSNRQSDGGDIQQHLVTARGWRADRHDAILDLALFSLPVCAVTNSQWWTLWYSLHSCRQWVYTTFACFAEFKWTKYLIVSSLTVILCAL